jgi:uncharacterized SAM-binding protein YcdF (DUF218 family)
MERLVMMIRLFLLIILAMACGPKVDISTKSLEYNSSLSTNISPNQEGTLERGTPDKIILSGTSYKVSVYSSHNALEFIAAKPLTTKMAIKFKGKTKGNEIVLEMIEAK